MNERLRSWSGYLAWSMMHARRAVASVSPPASPPASQPAFTPLQRRMGARPSLAGWLLGWLPCQPPRTRPGWLAVYLSIWLYVWLAAAGRRPLACARHAVAVSLCPLCPLSPLLSLSSLSLRSRAKGQGLRVTHHLLAMSQYTTTRTPC
jgi:hypothetical protein